MSHADHRRTFQDERLYRNDPRACPRDGIRKRRIEQLAPPRAATRYLDRREGRWLPGIRLDAVSATIQMDDAVNIQFTSGTTGLPKVATLSHHNLINNAFFVGEATGIEPGSRVCIPVPLYHCFGMVMGNLGCVTHAATMVYPSQSFDPLNTPEAVEAERCDVLYGVPTMFIAQLNHPEFSRFDLSALCRGIMAGAPCPIEVTKEVASTIHKSEITIAYGMTETSPVSFQSSRDDLLELRVSTVGRIHSTRRLAFGWELC